MNRYWTLSDRPLANWPQPDTFELREGPMPEPGPGQALTRTIYVSLDPYQWGYKRRGAEKSGGERKGEAHDDHPSRGELRRESHSCAMGYHLSPLRGLCARELSTASPKGWNVLAHSAAMGTGRDRNP